MCIQSYLGYQPKTTCRLLWNCEDDEVLDGLCWHRSYSMMIVFFYIYRFSFRMTVNDHACHICLVTCWQHVYQLLFKKQPSKVFCKKRPSCNFVKNRFQQRYFLVKFVKFLTKPILRISASDCFSCLLLPFSLFANIYMQPFSDFHIEEKQNHLCRVGHVAIL